MIVPDLEELHRSIHIKNEDFCYNKYPEFTEYIIQLYPDISHIERLYRYFRVYRSMPETKGEKL